MPSPQLELLKLDDDIPLVKHRPLIKPETISTESLYTIILHMHEDNTRVTKELQMDLLHRLRNHTTALLIPISDIAKGVELLQGAADAGKKFKRTINQTFILGLVATTASSLAAGGIAALYYFIKSGAAG